MGFMENKIVPGGIVCSDSFCSSNVPDVLDVKHYRIILAD